ncbi:hypothetical protein [Prauserella muralis]|uniref:PIN-like domain-containing protein n=1 Tax=Prauserella muralis TaxID=588067 RepID=UPI003CCC542D
MRLRKDVVTGSHKPVADLIPRKDEEWIPAVARYGWVAITNDRHIRTRFYEAAAALKSGLRCVRLRPPGRDANRWDFVRLLAAHWEAVEHLCSAQGPSGWKSPSCGPAAWTISRVNHRVSPPTTTRSTARRSRSPPAFRSPASGNPLQGVSPPCRAEGDLGYLACAQGHLGLAGAGQASLGNRA